MAKNSPAKAGDAGNTVSITGQGRSPGAGNGNPLQCSCLGNPMDREAWWATVYERAKSWTQQSAALPLPVSYQTLACDVFSLVFPVSTFTVSISSFSCLPSASHHISLLKQPPHWSLCQQFLNLCQSFLSIHSSHCIRVIFREKNETTKSKNKETV